MSTWIFAFLVMLCFAGGSAVGQRYYDRDSLWQVFRKSTPDTGRAKLYITLAQQYETDAPDSALRLYDAARSLSSELHYLKGSLDYYTNVTYVYNILGLYDTALVLNLKSVTIAEQLDDKRRLSECLSNVAASYLSLHDFESCIDYYLQAVPIAEQMGSTEQLKMIYPNLANACMSARQYAKALLYSKRMLTLAHENRNDFEIAGALNTMGSIYNALHKSDSARQVLEKSIAVARKSANDLGVVRGLLLLNDADRMMGNYTFVKNRCIEALSLAIKLDDDESRSISRYQLACYYITVNQLKRAHNFAMLSLKEALQNDYPVHAAKVYGVLSEIALLENKGKLYARYSWKKDSINDMLFKEAISTAIQNGQLKYALNRKDQENSSRQQKVAVNELLKSKRHLSLAVFGISITALVFLIFLLRNRYTKIT